MAVPLAVDWGAPFVEACYNSQAHPARPMLKIAIWHNEHHAPLNPKRAPSHKDALAVRQKCNYMEVDIIFFVVAKAKHAQEHCCWLERLIGTSEASNQKATNDLWL